MTLGRRMTPNLMFVNGFMNGDNRMDEFDHVHIMMDRHIIDDYHSKRYFW
jgi:hypothetical protein